MTNNDERNFQRNLAQDQIFYGGIISLGSTIFAIGATIWVLSLTVLDKMVSNQTTIFNLDGLNILATTFLFSGLMAIIFGFISPLAALRKKTERKKDLEICNCGNNILRCPIHGQ